MNVLRCALLLLACSTVVYGAADPGPQIGQAFAHSLSAPDQTGKTRTVTDLLGTNGLAVFFVRSADWCPFCKGQLVDANRHLQEFRSLGINLVSVSVDEVGPIAAFSAEQKIGYPMLSDPKGDQSEPGYPGYPVSRGQFGLWSTPTDSLRAGCQGCCAAALHGAYVSNPS
jgi:peroxiredoxin